ncbi:Tlg2-vesicle protein [Tulasnella sp. 331]|nr:Tlg2-vesicle protein [Tulasnella sp. 331]
MNFFKKKRNANANLSTSSLDFNTYNSDLDTSAYPPMSMTDNPTPGHLATIERPGPVRTPSPTPSDIEETKKGVIDWKSMFNWRTWAKKENIKYFLIFGTLSIIGVLITIYHTRIVNAIEPTARKVRQLPGGWSIPIGIMFVLSFPPLFGNEIIHVLCGIVWGLWIGFGIVCAGTFLGEIGNFYVFKYFCTARGEHYERTKLPYACLARCVREGGFLVALVARLSAIPGHFTTAVFATCGMSIWTFCLGAVLSLPKQFATVYLGVVLFEAAGKETTGQRITSGIVVTVSVLLTVFAAHWVLQKMAAAKPAVLAQRRKEKALAFYNQSHQMSSYSHQSDMESSEYGTENPGASTSTLTGGTNFNKPFNYDGSNVNLPLSVKPQRWDQNGRAILDNQPQLPYDPNAVNTSPNPFRSGVNAQNIKQDGMPMGTIAPPPPNIRIIRASQASTMSGPGVGDVGTGTGDRQASYDDVSLVTPTQATQAQSQPPPRFSSMPSSPPTRPSEDSSSNESVGPAWVAGTVGREDEIEVKSPLRMAEPQSFNPYDNYPSAPRSGHRQEGTGASGASYHTAQGGSYGGFENVEYPTRSDILAQQEVERRQGRS